MSPVDYQKWSSCVSFYSCIQLTVAECSCLVTELGVHLTAARLFVYEEPTGEGGAGGEGGELKGEDWVNICNDLPCSLDSHRCWAREMLLMF